MNIFYPNHSKLRFYIASFHRPAILLILLLAFFLRTYRLDYQALRGDEAATVLYAALPVTGLWELSRVTDPHPPLYYLMLHPWQWLVGEGAWSMRFAGVGASLLAVAALYALAQRTLRSGIAGLLAASLLAVNPFQIWLAQDIRAYPFFTLLGLLSATALWLALTRQQTADGGQQATDNGQQTAGSEQQTAASSQASTHPTPSALRSSLFALRSSLAAPHPLPWLLYVLLTLVSFYIHYYTVFLIAFEGLFVLVNLKKFWDKRWPWLASQLAIGLLMLPGLGLAYNFIGQAAGGIETIPTLDILRQASTALLSGFTLDDSWGLWLSLLLAPVWLTGLFSLWRRDAVSGSFWALFFAAPVVGVIAMSIDRPFFKERFLVQAQPAFELLLAAGFLTLVGGAKRMANERTANERMANERTANVPSSLPASRSSLPASRSSLPAPRSLDASRSSLSAPRLLASRLLAPLLLALLLYSNSLALSNYFTNPAYAKAPPWQLYHDYVSHEARPGDVMLTNFPEAAVSYYSPNELPFYVTPAERDRPVEFRLAETAQIAEAYRRIWFLPLQQQGFDEQGDVLNWLDRHADRVNQIFFPAYNLNLYLSPPTIETLLISQPVSFAEGLHLRGYQIFDTAGDSRIQTVDGTPVLTVEAGDEFTLSLYWQAGGPTAIPYTVFTHLIAADGFNRTGQDNQPVWNTYPTNRWQPGEKITDKYTLTVPPGTPPGDHRLRLGWYHSDTQERLPVLNNEGQPIADNVILGVIIRVE